MKRNKVLTLILASNLFISNTAANISLANNNIDNRYETIEGECIIIDNSKEGELHEIELFGNTVQDSDNLEDIQSVGELYVDEKGSPILDAKGREQFKIDIVSNKLQPVREGLVSWVDAKYGQPGDAVWKDISGNNNNFNLKGFTHDGTNGFNGESLRLLNTRRLKIESCDYVRVKKDESYSLEMFFDGEYVNYLIGLQHYNSASENGSYICTFGSKENYTVTYDLDKLLIKGNIFNKKNNHVVLIKDAKNDKIKVYLNAILIHERDIIDGDNSTNQKVQLGSHGNFEFISSINIYSHRRYNRILTESEIKNNYDYEFETRKVKAVEENRVSLILPTQLMKVGNISDRLYWDNTQKRYVVEKNIGIVNLKDVEFNNSDIDRPSTTENTICFVIHRDDMKIDSSTRTNTISNKFKKAKTSLDYSLDEELVYSSIGTKRLFVKILKSRLNSVDVSGFKEWLKENEVIMYYQLDKPNTILTNITSKLIIPTYDYVTSIYIETENEVNPNLKVVIDRLPQIAKNSILNAEESGLLKDISLARLYVNMLSESLYKDQLQERLNAVFSSEITIDRKAVSNNMDLYVKSENMLSMSLSTNLVTFENYSGVEDMELLNAVNITVHSSLPYDLNVYMPSEISNSDKSEFLGVDTLNIRESTKTEYQKFINTIDKVTLNENCDSGNDKIHSIDLKLSSKEAYKADVYKTILKFEIAQK